jgi:cytochrome b
MGGGALREAEGGIIDGASAGSGNRVRVWDGVVRSLHWSLAALVAVALITGWRHRATGLHELAGYGIAAAVALRVAWGVSGRLGTHFARFRNFPARPGRVAAYLLALVRGRAARYLGHSPAASAMALALLAVVFLLAATGTLAAGMLDLDGPFAFLFPHVSDHTALAVKHLHGAVTWLLGGMVVLHVAGVALSSTQHRENLVKAMVTGDKPRTTPRHPHLPSDVPVDVRVDLPVDVPGDLFPTPPEGVPPSGADTPPLNEEPRWVRR